MKKIYKSLMALAAAMLLPLSLTAQTPNREKYLYDEEKGIGYNKYLVSNTPDADGNYTLRIENFITGHVKATAVPTDFVLVLDVSGSMKYDYRPRSAEVPLYIRKSDDEARAANHYLKLRLDDGQERGDNHYRYTFMDEAQWNDGDCEIPTGTIIARFSGGLTPGDVDGNGSVSVSDAITTLRLSMQLLDGSSLNTDAADMDGNGSITIVDAIIIMRTAIGLA